MSEHRTTDTRASRLATGFITFAGVLMIMVGGFQALVGLVAVLQDDFYVIEPDGTVRDPSGQTPQKRSSMGGELVAAAGRVGGRVEDRGPLVLAQGEGRRAPTRATASMRSTRRSISTSSRTGSRPGGRAMDRG